MLNELKQQLTCTHCFKIAKDLILLPCGDVIWKKIGELDSYIQTTKPFSMVKREEKSEKQEAEKIIKELVKQLFEIAVHLRPIMPETAKQIEAAIIKHQKPEKPIFERV